MNLDQRLSDAAWHIAEQVDPPEVDLHAIRSRAHAKRRAAVSLAVAAATVALAGVQLLVGGRDSTAPRPASSPTDSIIRTLGDADCSTGARCLEPGAYAVDLGHDGSGQPLRAMLTVPGAGWQANGLQHEVADRSSAGAVVLKVYQPYELAGPRPCDGEGATTPVAHDVTIDGVARLLATLEQLAVVDGPRALRAFGHDARYLQVGADPITCPGGVQYNLADIYGGDGLGVGGDSDIDSDQRVVIQFWVVDLAGEVIVVEARQEGSPGNAAIQALDEVRDSLTFVAP